MFSELSFLAAGDTHDFITPLIPEATAGGPYTTHFNVGVQINGIVTENAGSDILITWSSDNPGSFNDPNIEAPIFTPTDEFGGDYILTLTVTTSNTNPVIDTATLTSLVTAPTVDAGGPYSTDIGVPLQINGIVTPNDGNNILITWSSDNQGSFNDPNIEAPIFTPTDTGSYILTLTVTTSNTTPATDTAALTSLGIPAIVEAAGPYTTYPGWWTQLNATVIPGSDPLPAIQWYRNTNDYVFENQSIAATRILFSNLLSAGQHNIRLDVQADDYPVVSDSAIVDVLLPLPNDLPIWTTGNTASDGSTVDTTYGSVNAYYGVDRNLSTTAPVSEIGGVPNELIISLTTGFVPGHWFITQATNLNSHNAYCYGSNDGNTWTLLSTIGLTVGVETTAGEMNTTTSYSYFKIYADGEGFKEVGISVE